MRRTWPGCGCCWIARRRMFEKRREERKLEEREKRADCFWREREREVLFFVQKGNSNFFKHPLRLLSLFSLPPKKTHAISEELAPSSVIPTARAAAAAAALLLLLALAPARSCGSSCAIASGVALHDFSGE